MPLQDTTFIFGVLEPTVVNDTDTDLLSFYSVDHLYVAEYATYNRYVCKCRRTEPILVSKDDLNKSTAIHKHYACSVCLNELRNSRSPSTKVEAWLRQNKYTINPNAHLYLPDIFKRLVDTDDNTIMRPRRFIYAHFYDVELNQKDKIMGTCGDPDCVNPCHMMRAASTATKVTPEIRNDIQTWVMEQKSSKTIQGLVQSKYNKSLSLRTITNIKRSMRASNVTPI